MCVRSPLTASLRTADFGRAHRDEEFASRPSLSVSTSCSRASLMSPERMRKFEPRIRCIDEVCVSSMLRLPKADTAFGPSPINVSHLKGSTFSIAPVKGIC
ncbi:hypothetical protein ElyMa_002963400 [Elysia marginata]|uniref:Uncharacterized protein n=1 Tax=Elysia marginata TaxID=1093978 RepID=A0AAV4IB41_9GAST|nr:hypothetical protein ElyMa_002963400 [Elysia marginata]